MVASWVFRSNQTKWREERDWRRWNGLHGRSHSGCQENSAESPYWLQVPSLHSSMRIFSFSSFSDGFNQITDNGLLMFSAFARRAKKLQRASLSLNFGGNEIKEEGIKALGGVFSNKQFLQELTINIMFAFHLARWFRGATIESEGNRGRKNQITDEGFKLFSSKLVNLPKLKKINFDMRYSHQNFQRRSEG